MQSRVTVIGGTGFLGRQVTLALNRAGYDVQVVSRRALECRELFPSMAGGGRLVLRNGDVKQPKTLLPHLEGSFAVVNLVGVLYEKGRQRFSTLHSQCAERVAQMAKEAGVERLIHISALGVHDAPGSRYAQSKATGESLVFAAFPSATVLSPSVIFGSEDNFINQFRKMARLSPILPLIGGGRTLFQPVYVGDVAQAVVACLARDDTMGKTLELGGPEKISFHDILRRIARFERVKRLFVEVPWFMAGAIGLFSELLPVPPLTRDQVELLKYDNVVSGEDGFKLLGISPKPLSYMLPGGASTPDAAVTQNAMQEAA